MWEENAVKLSNRQLTRYDKHFNLMWLCRNSFQIAGKILPKKILQKACLSYCPKTTPKVSNKLLETVSCCDFNDFKNPSIK